MTDKQIIIDGIDVSGCPHLIEDRQWWNIAGQEEHDINCCALSFDEYRDFEEDDFCKENPNCYYKNWKRKEQECEELKDLNTRLDNQRETYWKGYQKLKATLTEIKEIAEEYQKEYIVNNGIVLLCNQIFQKISECEE